jgi:general secretion pathway protein G
MQKMRGFTLIEIMVVVVILGILGALVIPKIMSKPDEARIVAAQTDIRNIASALDMYKLDNFNYPSTAQGLQALVTKPSGSPEAKNWNPEGYLKKVPKDPWGNPYQYISPGAHGPFDLYSWGTDGQEGGTEKAADIVSWEVL